MPIFCESEVLLSRDFSVILYQVFPISWDCYLSCVIHCGECVTKDHMVLGVNVLSYDI